MPQGKQRTSLALIGILVGIALAGLWLSRYSLILSWLVMLVLMITFLVVAGAAITGLRRGLLIDGRNKISLSRFQLIAWTVVVLSAFLTAALFNIRAGADDPLAIAIPEQLWILMGISTTSLIGSPLLLGSKRGRKADSAEFKKVRKELPEEERKEVETNEEGDDKSKEVDLVVRNKTREASRWTDMFKGEEAGNFAYMDMAKVQMFFFTFVIVFAYAVSLGQLFSEGGGVVKEFPTVHESIVVLLGISHTGYLAGKALPHSREAR